MNAIAKSKKIEAPTLAPVRGAKRKVGSAARLLAQIVIDAMHLHYSSFNYAQHLRDLEREQKARKDRRANNPSGDCMEYFINYTSKDYHKIPLMQACEQAAGNHPELAFPVYLLITGYQNDAEFWAYEMGAKPHPDHEAHMAASEKWQQKMDAIYEKYQDKKPAAVKRAAVPVKRVALKGK